MAFRLRLALLASLLFAPAGLASVSETFERDAYGPTAVRSDAGWSGFAFCVQSVQCPDSGLGAIIALDGTAKSSEQDLNENGRHAPNPAGSYVWAEGTCTVRRYVTYASGPFSFVCGVDRDDDGAVTNADFSGSTDVDGFDDDFAARTVGASSSGGAVNVCFRADAGPSGASWDTMSVFIASNLPSVQGASWSSGAVGLFEVEVELTTRSACSTNSSGHTHSNWSGSGAASGTPCGPIANAETRAAAPLPLACVELLSTV